VHFVFTTLGYHPDQTGGAFRYVTEIAEGLAALSHTVHVVYPSTEKSTTPHVQEFRNGVHLHRFNFHRAAFFYNWLDRNNAALERLKVARPPNYPSILVSCHGYFSSAVARSGEPIVSLFTGPWAEEFLLSRRMANHPKFRKRIVAPILRKVESVALKRSRSILTISEYYQQNLKTWHPEIWRPVHVINGGVKTDQFRPHEKPTALRESLGLKQDEFLFLAIRRLEPRMGLIELIDAFHSIIQDFPKARLWIGGAGALRSALEMRIKIFALEDRVRLLGFVPESDLPKFYSAAHCTVMPSIDLEGFGLSTVESLACGTPVIGSRRGATPEILEPLDPSLLYEPADLAAKMRDVLKNPAGLPNSKTCRDYAVSHYSWSGPINAFERICLQIPESKT
jgi:glycosyltransferase involved in cell wall biosynthesis